MNKLIDALWATCTPMYILFGYNTEAEFEQAMADFREKDEDLSK